MKFEFVEEKENLIKDTALRDIKLVTAYMILQKYAVEYSYSQRIEILSKEFSLSFQGVKNIIQKLRHE
tara:strand:+ start:725 stop:928 length:204 start_codon:yes stop_codon:yes gene_type:complete